jgi:hypothetical protein
MKKSLLIIVTLCRVTLSVSAQTLAQPWGYMPNPPILDATNLIKAIQSGMDMYQQLTSIYQTIQTNIERLEEQRKSFESFDLRQLSLSDPLGSWRRIMTYGSRMMTYEDNIEAILNRKDIKIGSASYSLSDLYTTNPVTNVTEMTGNVIQYTFNDPFERQLTPHEKAVFHQKYGISYGHYMRYHRMRQALSKKAGEVTAYNEKLEEELAADREAIQTMLEEQGDGSWVQEQQKINSLLTAKNQNLKTKTKLISDIADMYANIAAEKKIDREAQQKNDDVDFGDNYLEIMEKTGKKNDYMGHQYPLN